MGIPMGIPMGNPIGIPMGNPKRANRKLGTNRIRIGAIFGAILRGDPWERSLGAILRIDP